MVRVALSGSPWTGDWLSGEIAGKTLNHLAMAWTVYSHTHTHTHMDTALWTDRQAAASLMGGLMIHG